MNVHDPAEPIPGDLTRRVVESYRSDRRTAHLDSTFLPNRARTIEIIELLRRVIFPGFFEHQRLISKTLDQHVGQLLAQAHESIYAQAREALRYEENRTSDDRRGDTCDHCDEKARAVTDAFLERIPELRQKLALDVQAGYDGDPAAHGTDEIIFCYPGLDAIFIHRVAHEFYKLGVPLLPRIMSEYAHNETGIDIHPGATIGDSFFIDHGTGVVIGETVEIGNRVKIYQGVTLGALSTKAVEALRGRKRHPTIEDDVTIYGGAIILGGTTVIGKGSTIGGSVFLTHSVPPAHTVVVTAPALKMSSRGDRGKKGVEDGWDFNI